VRVKFCSSPCPAPSLPNRRNKGKREMIKKKKKRGKNAHRPGHIRSAAAKASPRAEEKKEKGGGRAEKKATMACPLSFSLPDAGEEKKKRLGEKKERKGGESVVRISIESLILLGLTKRLAQAGMPGGREKKKKNF